MNQNAQAIDIIDATAFLAVSCEHLELDAACLYRAAHRVYSSAIAQPVRIGARESELHSKSMDHYRLLARRMLVAVGAGVLLAGPALADPACPGMGMDVTQQEHHTKQMEQHHNQLHAALKLTPEQEAGWTRLLASEPQQPMPGGAQTMEWSKLSAPERAEKMLERSKAHQEQMSEHVAALKAFYGTLTAEQKQAFEDFHSGRQEGKRGPPKPSGSGTAPAKS